MSQKPRLTSVMGVARALLATLSTDEAVDVLLTEFGWDVSFQALSLLRGAGADEAFARCWEHLVLGALTTDLDAETPTWLPGGA